MFGLTAIAARKARSWGVGWYGFGSRALLVLFGFFVKQGSRSTVRTRRRQNWG